MRNLWEGGYQGEGYLRKSKEMLSNGLRKNWQVNAILRMLESTALNAITDGTCTEYNTTNFRTSGNFRSRSRFAGVRSKTFASQTQYDFYIALRTDILIRHFGAERLGEVLHCKSTTVPIQPVCDGVAYVGLVQNWLRSKSFASDPCEAAS